jgi:hypothetical protein
VLRLYGIPVAEDDVLWLVYRLRQVGRATDVSAAAMIEKGLRDELVAVALTTEERTAILGVLDNPADGLAELRGRLLTNHHLYSQLVAEWGATGGGSSAVLRERR